MEEEEATVVGWRNPETRETGQNQHHATNVLRGESAVLSITTQELITILSDYYNGTLCVFLSSVVSCSQAVTRGSTLRSMMTFLSKPQGRTVLTTSRV